jgi:hypothetical protein
MARVQVRGRSHPGEGCEVTRADRPLARKRVGVMAARGRRKRSDWYWADLRVCVCIDRKAGDAGRRHPVAAPDGARKGVWRWTTTLSTRQKTHRRNTSSI